jgi:hypothetical protein
VPNPYPERPSVHPCDGARNPGCTAGTLRGRRRREVERVRQLPAVVVLAVVGLGLLLAAVVDWQLGALVLALGLLLAAGLRLALPARQAGWLAVRTRALDATVLLGLGFVVVLLANTIPRP